MCEKGRTKRREKSKRWVDSREIEIPRKNEATKIWFTRDSLFWAWRRVKEYYKEIEREEKMNDCMREARAIINS